MPSKLINKTQPWVAEFPPKQDQLAKQCQSTNYGFARGSTMVIDGSAGGGVFMPTTENAPKASK